MMFAARSISRSIGSLKTFLKAAKRNGPSASSAAEDRPSAAKNLKRLLTIRQLSMIAKARSLHIDHANVFCSARVITDLRPVFDADVGEEPTDFVVVHTLKLGFHLSEAHELHQRGQLDETKSDRLTPRGPCRKEGQF